MANAQQYASFDKDQKTHQILQQLTGRKLNLISNANATAKKDKKRIKNKVRHIILMI